MIRVFDVSQPGRSFEARPTCKTRKSKTGQRGIISALAFCPEMSGGGLFAAGSYAKTICLYSENRWAHGSDLILCRNCFRGVFLIHLFMSSYAWIYIGATFFVPGMLFIDSRDHSAYV